MSHTDTSDNETLLEAYTSTLRHIEELERIRLELGVAAFNQTIAAAITDARTLANAIVEIYNGDQVECVTLTEKGTLESCQRHIDG